jgi:hypothetical protein
MKKFLITFVILLYLPMLILSQDAEPTLTANELYHWSAEVYFPQVIDFMLLARRSESVIASLTLTISFRGSDPNLITIDPATVTATDAGGVFRYRWDIPKDIPPPLFSRVRYTWDIVTVNGLSYAITDDLDFIDQRVNWVQSNDRQSQVNVFHAFNQLDADDVRNGIRATYNVLFANVEDRPIYTLLVYPETVSIGCDVNEDDEPIIRIQGVEEFEEIACDMSLANHIYTQGEYIVFNQTSVDKLQQTIIDLLIKEYYLKQWDNMTVPDWFLYGLQQFYTPRTKLSALNLTQQKSRSDDLLTMNDLETPPIDDETRLLWDAQSIGMILYLADTIGVQGLFEFADSIGGYDTFAEAYEDHVRQSLDLLILSWNDWMFRPSSRQDYDYNPYLPATSTPTATATLTNTPTATFTPSKTPNVTRTPRPSITPIPPTPSTTPLPAQSFSVQPTDAPPTPILDAPPQQFTVDEGLLSRVVVGGAVILGLLMLLYFVLRRR